ncbi:conserved hypothetical protein [Talaromyces stipitatus ATCC 10500]|uniref:SMODS and SLOG-associating 2TM effector domain-containing protein n=1 Tax=Talaromyces stipitatus (strain ATCC 10500 / CBS 375.48 / QM 6759 / NRRL 1006) TaxID=441959 RepID=B8MGB5_TALSN|nr:uncharacterized protein TSTA_013380 [Talaromyces stipitatus ATCC 10500]EED16235.1 conserved hypothetical protein [Talaromyces stipitatus ATCC 10500]
MVDDHSDEHHHDEEPTESSPLLPKTDKKKQNETPNKQQQSNTNNKTDTNRNMDNSTAPITTSPTQSRANTTIGPPIDIKPGPTGGTALAGGNPNAPKRQDTQSWPAPAGLPPRDDDDESLIIFRRAIGINYNLAAADTVSMEEGRRKAVGIYHAVIKAKRNKMWQFRTMWCVILFCHFAQIIIGAALTALGPLANDHGIVITILGALNTVIAGVLALVSGQGLPDRIQKDEIGYRKIQDWIEETEALLSVGIIGRNRKEVGLLVEEAFKKYNAAKSNEENNRPSSYVNAPEEPSRATGDGRNASTKYHHKFLEKEEK